MRGTVVWSEGMFIAPQHFQHLDISVQRYINEVAQLDLSYSNFGVSELEINFDLLKVGKFGVRDAAGVFPDRLFFRLTKDLVKDIPDGVVEETIYLAVPLVINGTAQFGGEDDMARMVKSNKELRDLNDPTNEPIEAELAEVGVCLRMGSDDFSGYASIAIARVLEKTADGRVLLDRSFVPHVLQIQASKVLMERLDEIVSLARARAANTAGRVAADTGKRSEASLMTERQELQLLNRWLLILQNEVAAGAIGPRRLYSYLASMSVELDGILGEITDPSMIYNPEKMATGFENIFAGLRRKLTLEKPASVLALSWNTELFAMRRVLRLIIPTRNLGEKRRLILALSGPDNAQALSEMGPSSCKLAGLSAMPDLVARGLPGIELKPLSVPPPELRSRSDAAFFAINTSSAHWQRYLEKREALALHVDDRIQTVDATLYMLD